MKAFVILLVVLALLGLLGGCKFVAVRSELTAQKEEIGRLWADVDDGLQRRTELIPGLIELVRPALREGNAKGDNAAIDALAASRTAMLSATSPQKKIDVYYQMNSALERVHDVVDNYPNLKAAKKFQSLGFRLEQAENSILEARQRYNEAIQKYNTTLSLFPDNLVAQLAGFTRNDAYFRTGVNARNVPKWTF